MPAVEMVWLAAYWVGYFVLHSLLASLGLKQAVARYRPGLMPAYRLSFNVIAIALAIPPLWYIHAHPGPLYWEWQGTWWWLAQGAGLSALIGFLTTLRGYDLREFVGLRQWRAADTRPEDQESFHLSALHRFVRHPWYFLALVIVWTRDLSAGWLVTATMITLYFIVGSRLEERKLIRYHGRTYVEYRARVPGLLPLPGRYLSVGEAKRLMRVGGGRVDASAVAKADPPG